MPACCYYWHFFVEVARAVPFCAGSVGVAFVFNLVQFNDFTVEFNDFTGEFNDCTGEFIDFTGEFKDFTGEFSVSDFG